MTKVYHINCGTLHAPPNPVASCHCLLLEDNNKLALVDTGIGFIETQYPFERIGKSLIDIAGFKFDPEQTAVSKINKLGFETAAVKHAVISHLDPDHIGGLVDFPNLHVHVAEEEYTSFKSGDSRYLPIQLSHNPELTTYAPSTKKWFGLEARKVNLDFESDVFLVPLFAIQWGIVV